MELPVEKVEVERVLRRSRSYKDRHAFTTIVDDVTAARITELCLAEDISRSEALRRLLQCGLNNWSVTNDSSSS